MNSKQEPDLSSLNMYITLGKNLIEEGKLDEFNELIIQLNNEGKFRGYMEDEAFLAMYLKYKMLLEHYEDVCHILQNVENARDPVFIEFWDEAHYRQHCQSNAFATLTPIAKFRIRKRNPPPPGICPSSVRPSLRLSEKSSAILQEWYSKHSTYPYPCRKAKIALATRADIPIKKLENWFTNARRRHRNHSGGLDKSDSRKRSGSDLQLGRKSKYGVKMDSKSVGTNNLKEIPKLNEDMEENQKQMDGNIDEKLVGSLENQEASNNVFLVTFETSNTGPNQNEIDEQFGEGILSNLSTEDARSLSTLYEEVVPNNVEVRANDAIHHRDPFADIQNKTNIMLNNDNFLCQNLDYPTYNNHTVEQIHLEKIEKSNVVLHKRNPAKRKPKRMWIFKSKIRPKLKYGENQAETKFGTTPSIWKLRVQLTKKHDEQSNEQNTKATEDFSIGNAADECVRSLQKMCEGIENNVVSPVDYACSVEIDVDKNDEEILVDETTIQDDDTGYSVTSENSIDCNSKSDSPTDTGVHLGLDIETADIDAVGWTYYDFYNSALHTASRGEEIGVPIITEMSLHTERRLPVEERDVTGQPCMLQGCTDLVSVDGPSRSHLETYPCHINDLCMTDSECYGTVVREAIQGLLNLSSSQESICSCPNYGC